LEQPGSGSGNAFHMDDNSLPEVEPLSFEAPNALMEGNNEADASVEQQIDLNTDFVERLRQLEQQIDLSTNFDELLRQLEQDSEYYDEHWMANPQTDLTHLSLEDDMLALPLTEDNILVGSESTNSTPDVAPLQEGSSVCPNCGSASCSELSHRNATASQRMESKKRGNVIWMTNEPSFTHTSHGK
jgi:hypothetical protein